MEAHRWALLSAPALAAIAKEEGLNGRQVSFFFLMSAATIQRALRLEISLNVGAIFLPGGVHPETNTPRTN
jgi:hypothetical protein